MQTFPDESFFIFIVKLHSGCPGTSPVDFLQILLLGALGAKARSDSSAVSDVEFARETQPRASAAVVARIRELVFIFFIPKVQVLSTSMAWQGLVD